eukprot:gene11173-18786_t
MAQAEGPHKGQVPFSQSRLRGYQSRIEGVIDPRMSVANSIALATAPGELVFPPVRGQSNKGNGGPKSAGGTPSDPQPDSMAHEIDNLKAEIAGVETVLTFMRGADSASTTMGRKVGRQATQEQLKQKADLYVRALNEAPQHKAGRAGSPLAPGFETITQDVRRSTTWKQPAALRPVGRGEAVILEAALDEALPAGAIASKYQATAKLAGGAGTPLSPALLLVESQTIKKDYETVEMVQQEAARQVSAHCSDRGRLLLKIAERYGELYATMSMMVLHMYTANGKLENQVASMSKNGGARDASLTNLQASLSSKDDELAALNDQVANLTAKVEHQRWDYDQQTTQLILAAEVEHYREKYETAIVDQESLHASDEVRAHVSNWKPEHSESLRPPHGASLPDRPGPTAVPQSASRVQRIRFIERQLVKARGELTYQAETYNAECQTDPVQLLDEGSDEGEGEDMFSGLQVEEEMEDAPVATAPVVVKKKRRGMLLGAFMGMMGTNQPGKARGVKWTSSCIAQIYFDKTVADSIADREGNARMGLTEYVYEWHLTKFGLRNLAEGNLLDLIASVRFHGRSSQRIRWFGQFNGLIESGEAVDSIQHVSYYLFMLQQLAYPSSVTALFPEGAEDPPVSIKIAVLNDAVRAIFRYLNDPEAGAAFITRHVDPITDPDLMAVPLDSIVRLLMQEFQRRLERNVAHLKALFK